MRTLFQNSAKRVPTILAWIAAFLIPVYVLAQPAERYPGPAAKSGHGRPDAASEKSKGSDLLIKTQDVSGISGQPLPLDIKLVRVRNVYIETVKLLGLPRGVVVSDSTNEFSSLSDNNDVDISSWELSTIWITQPSSQRSSFSLAVAAIWTPETGGHIDVTSSRFTVNFAAADPDPDPQTTVEDRPAPAQQSAAIRELGPASVLSSELHAPASRVFVPEAPPVPPIESAAPVPSVESAPPAQRAVSGGGDPVPVTERRAAIFVPPPAPARPPAEADALVERARGLIRLGDISGARLLLERARARNAPNATFLLAQTWDPEMLRMWKVRGLRADPELARSLYAKAAEQGTPDERLLAAARR